MKIIVVTMFSFVMAFSDGFPTLSVGMSLSFGLILFAGLNLRLIFKRMVIINGLAVMLWLVLPLTYEGETIWEFAGLTFSRPGVMLAAGITIKMNAIMLAFIGWVTTSPLPVLGHAMNRLHIPEKFVFLLLITYRYIFVIEEEYFRLNRAIKMRGFVPGTNIHTYKTYAYLVGMLFVRAWNMANRVHWAMMCRGFNGKFYSLHEFSFSREDGVYSFFSILCLSGLLIMEWMNPFT